MEYCAKDSMASWSRSSSISSSSNNSKGAIIDAGSSRVDVKIF